MSDSELKVSDLLESIPSAHTEEKIRFDALVASLHEKGLPLLVAFFSIPMCIPIPYPPGFSTLVAITIGVFALQMYSERETMWLPAWLAKRTITRTTLVKMLGKAIPKLRWMESRFKERWFYFCSARSEITIASIILLMNLIISIPLPGIHFFPGWSIMIMCLGLINRDGKVVAIGIATAIFAVAFAIGEILLGKTLILAIMHG
jgi:hypothetical protein